MKSFILGKSAFELKHKLSNGEIRDVEVFTGPIKVNRKEPDLFHSDGYYRTEKFPSGTYTGEG